MATGKVDRVLNHSGARSFEGNRYFAMRHGESLANVEGTIVSRPSVEALQTVGLTTLGRKQVSAAAEGWDIGADVVILTSDFARASQTADIVAALLGVSAPIPDIRLRERDFGDFEGTSADNYQKVWRGDASNEPLPSVEDVHSLSERTRDLIADLDSRFTGRTILLIAHGDTLQILQTVFEGIPAVAHRSLPPLRNAEIRLLSK